jgi:dTDP-4-amino-4,6-dideoxygalactose transaminase
VPILSDGIPFNRPGVTGDELAYIADALARGHISGDGFYTRRCQELLERQMGVPKVLLTTSCTHALEEAALLLDLKLGDEVIVPSFTFVSTVNAFVLRGARPVFADIRPDTLNLDETKLAGLVTPRTRAIFVVHYAGVGCAMEPILALAEERGLSVVEDNAHGLFGSYKGRPLGSFGALATQSFHETKNFTCGEGGALVINDRRLVERAEILREKGTDRCRFFRGEVDKYRWVDLGSSYLPADLLAAFLLAQLEQREAIQAARRRIWEGYDTELASWAERLGIGRPHVPQECEQPYHIYYLLLRSEEQRQRLIAHLKARSILAVFHYVPLHTAPMGQRYGYRPGDLPVTEDVSERLLRLPFFNQLTASDQQRVVAALLEFSG